MALTISFRSEINLSQHWKGWVVCQSLITSYIITVTLSWFMNGKIKIGWHIKKTCYNNFFLIMQAVHYFSELTAVKFMNPSLKCFIYYIFWSLFCVHHDSLHLQVCWSCTQLSPVPSKRFSPSQPISWSSSVWAVGPRRCRLSWCLLAKVTAPCSSDTHTALLTPDLYSPEGCESMWYCKVRLFIFNFML